MLSCLEVEVLAVVCASVEPLPIVTISKKVDSYHSTVTKIVSRYEEMGILTCEVKGRVKLVSIKNAELARVCLDLRNLCRRLEL